MGRVACSPSTEKAAARETPKATQRCHSGFQASTASISMKVAKASLSQMPFHQLIVTRSPNHMWAFSWATTSATRCSSAWEAAPVVDEQGGLPEGDGAEVLHGAGREVGDGQQVELVAGIGQAVVVLEVPQRGHRDLLAEGGQRPLAGHAPHAQRRVAHAARLGVLQLADHEGDQVRRHLDGVGEAHDLAATLGRLRQDAGVGDDGERRVDGQRHVEHRLEGRLVPAGEGTAGVGGLELGGGHRAGDAARVLVDRPIETAQLVVEGAAEDQPQAPAARGQRLGERQPAALGGLVERDRRPLLAIPGIDDHRLVDGELDGVQHDLADRLVDRDGDRLLAAEGQRGEVGIEPDVVTARDNGAR